MNSRKTVKIKSSVVRLIFIALGKRKSDSESESVEATSGMSTDEGEEKRKKKGKKLVKHKDKKRERIGRGIHSEIFLLYIHTLIIIPMRAFQYDFKISILKKITIKL